MAAPTLKKRKRNSHPRFEYYISKGGIPCCLIDNPSLCRGAMAMPCKAGEALVIIGQGYRESVPKANRLITRSAKVFERLGGALGNPVFTPTPAMYELAAAIPGVYKIEKRKCSITMS